MRAALLILFVAVVASASDVKKVVQTKQVSYHNNPVTGYASHQTHATNSYTNTAVYHGQYNGKCGNDGFYYNDYSSFVMCSNGNAYIQPCAPGSQNSANNNYQYGSSYNYRDFCDVNLVDDGYTLKHGAYNTGYHGNEAASYGHDGGHGLNAGYGLSSGYGVNSDYGANAGHGFGAGYGHNTPVQAAGYGSHGHNAGYNTHGNNDGFRGQIGYAGSAGYDDKSYGGIYQKTEYKTYGTANKAH